MMYASWDMECSRHNFLSIWAIFPLLPQHWPQKLKFGENVKKATRYPFSYVYHKWRSYDVWVLRYPDRVFYHFGPFFTIWLPQQPKKSKFLKMKNKNNNNKKNMPGNIIILNLCTTKMIICFTVPEICSTTIFCHFKPCFALLSH